MSLQSAPFNFAKSVTWVFGGLFYIFQAWCWRVADGSFKYCSKTANQKPVLINATEFPGLFLPHTHLLWVLTLRSVASLCTVRSSAWFGWKFLPVTSKETGVTILIAQSLRKWKMLTECCPLGNTLTSSLYFICILKAVSWRSLWF